MARVPLLSLLAAGLMTSPAVGQDDWGRADQDAVRLAPAAFVKLPARVIQAIESRRCTVPQSFADTARHNVIIGHFETQAHTDYAILCSRARSSTIFVVWGAPSSCPDEMEVRSDRSYLVKNMAGQIRFSRRIALAVPAYIRLMYQRFGGDSPPKLDHEGISDIFEGKESLIRYCSRGHWLELTGNQVENGR